MHEIIRVCPLRPPSNERLIARSRFSPALPRRKESATRVGKQSFALASSSRRSPRRSGSSRTAGGSMHRPIFAWRSPPAFSSICWNIILMRCFLACVARPWRAHGSRIPSNSARHSGRRNCRRMPRALIASSATSAARKIASVQRPGGRRSVGASCLAGALKLSNVFRTCGR